MFLDESGLNFQMSPKYGRGYIGQRVYYASPVNRGNYHTVISAINYQEVISALYGSWAGNGNIFLNYLEHCLCPKLHRNQTVIMDNVSFHKVDGVAQLLSDVGVELIYLPPYSPDLNPIEQMWSKIKTYLRQAAARTTGQLQYALKTAFLNIVPEDLMGWFKHCGFSDQDFRVAL